MQKLIEKLAALDNLAERLPYDDAVQAARTIQSNGCQVIDDFPFMAESFLLHSLIPSRG